VRFSGSIPPVRERGRGALPQLVHDASSPLHQPFDITSTWTPDYPTALGCLSRLAPGSLRSFPYRYLSPRVGTGVRSYFGLSRSSSDRSDSPRLNRAGEELWYLELTQVHERLIGRRGRRKFARVLLFTSYPSQVLVHIKEPASVQCANVEERAFICCMSSCRPCIGSC
jgi:hypothetical protein